MATYDHSVTKNQLQAMLNRGVVKLVFRKKSDNSLRTMLATTSPGGGMPPAPAKPSARPIPESHLLVWDTEADGLRSLDLDTLTEKPELVFELGG